MEVGRQGAFIVIDGTDGSGKTVQFKRLVARLRAENIPTSTADFPQYGQPSAHFVERYLNGKYGGITDVGPKAASLFYALDRFEAKKPLQQKLKEGRVLVSNRYVTANMGHQAAKLATPKERAEFLDWLEELEYGILGIPRPTLQIILSVPHEISYKLVALKEARSYTKRKRDLHEADREHLRLASEAYQEIAQRDKTFHLIACAPEGQIRSIEAIHEEIWGFVSQHLKMLGVSARLETVRLPVIA